MSNRSHNRTPRTKAEADSRLTTAEALDQPTEDELSGWNSPQAASFAERHSVLIDKKFSQGLSHEEEMKLEHIRTIFDEYDAPFYKPIIERLSALAAQLSKEKSTQTGK